MEASQISICKFKGNEQSICHRFGPELGIDGSGVWETTFTSSPLMSGVSEYSGFYIDLVPGFGYLGQVIFNGDSFAGGGGVISKGFMAGAGYQSCTMIVHTCRY